MTRLLPAFLCVFTLLSARADDGTSTIDLPWDSPYALHVPDSEIIHPEQGPPVLKITIKRDSTNKGWLESRTTLFRIPDPKIDSQRYVLTGEAAYTNLGSESCLQLVSSFLESDVMISKTNAAAGLQGYLSGTSDFRPFAIPFYWGTGKPAKLLQLEIGEAISAYTPTSGDVAGTLSLRNLKLVIYPYIPPPPSVPAPAATPEMGAAPAPAAPPSPGLHWPSFWIGAAASAVALLAFAQLVVLARRVQKARHDQEMRRIASLDS